MEGTTSSNTSSGVEAGKSTVSPTAASTTTNKSNLSSTDPIITDDDWPTDSARALPPLDPHVVEGLRCHGNDKNNDKPLQFATNADACALKLSPSGRLLAVAFSDGTLRLFDLTGRYAPPPAPKTTTTTTSRGRPAHLVLSHQHQYFGAVVAQIQAKGVHTSLIMDVDVSPDGLWFFCGAVRGSMELVAVYVGDLEASFAQTSSTSTITSTSTSSSTTHQKKKNNLLDLVTVHRHSDAKLRGFSACTRIPHTREYLLLTGRGIKTCHVWKFVPPGYANDKPVFTKMLHLPTNGNSIKFLNFRRMQQQQHDSLLQVVSKSDDFCVRLWDWPSGRACADVPFSASALAVAGDFLVCGGGHEHFNQISVVSLSHPTNAYTELALPHAAAANHKNKNNRRQQRGDLKSVQAVASMTCDAGHAVLEVSDGSLLHYADRSRTQPTLQRMSELTASASLSRKLTVGRIGAEGWAVAAMATFDPACGRGQIRLVALEEVGATAHRTGFWGFLGLPRSGAATNNDTPREKQRDALTASHESTLPTLARVTPCARKVSKDGGPRQLITTTATKKRKKIPSKERTSLQSKVHLKDTIPLALPSTSSNPRGNNTGPSIVAVSSEKARPVASRCDDSGRKPGRPKTMETIVQSRTSGFVKVGSNATTFSKPKKTSAAKVRRNNKTQLEASAAGQLSRLPRVAVIKIDSAFKLVPSESVGEQEGNRTSSRPTTNTTPQSSRRALAISNRQAAIPKSSQSFVPLPKVTPKLSPLLPRKRSAPSDDTSLVLGRCSTPTLLEGPKLPGFQSPRTVTRKKNDTMCRPDLVKACNEKIQKLQRLLLDSKTRKNNQRSKPNTSSDAALPRLLVQHAAEHSYIEKRVLRMTLAIVQSLKAVPTRAAWLEAQAFLEEQLEDVQRIVVRFLFCCRCWMVASAVSDSSFLTIVSTQCALL